MTCDRSMDFSGYSGLFHQYFMVKFRIFIPELWDFIHQIVHDFKTIFRMSRCKLRTPFPIHFKLCIDIGIDSLMVCILFGEISIFHSRVMGLYVEIKHYNSLSPITLEWKIEISPKCIQTIRLSIPITMRSLKWIGQGVLNLQRDIWKIGYNLMKFFVCHAVNWEPLSQFTSKFA
jgi:hypothetical protein